MTNTYRPLSEAAKSQYGDAVVSLDLSVMDERDAVDGGHLEIVPRPYKVLSDNFSGGPQDSEWLGALRVELEAALIQGGHIERIEAPPVKVGPADVSVKEAVEDAPAKKK
jgi:hypothetical protein